MGIGVWRCDGDGEWGLVEGWGGVVWLLGVVVVWYADLIVRRVWWWKGVGMRVRVAEWEGMGWEWE